MVKFTKRLASIIFLTLFLATAIVSCGKQGNKEEQSADEHPSDSTKSPSDSTEHPADASEHPADSTKNQ